MQKMLTLTCVVLQDDPSWCYQSNRRVYRQRGQRGKSLLSAWPLHRRCYCWYRLPADRTHALHIV